MPTTESKEKIKLLAEMVSVSSRFQRAIRIDTDLGSAGALEGFICPKSSIDALLNMSRHIGQTNHCAFTWTGPYGSGKSSLLVALGSLLSGDRKISSDAAKVLGEHHADEILSALPPKKNGWRILPVVGRRDDPAKVIYEALCKNTKFNTASKTQLNDNKIINRLIEEAQSKPKSQGGIIVFIDEMGKFLEGAAGSGSDIYFFQQLAEAASRSNNRLIVIGVLHQAFSEYAHRLSREMRDEWSKIQGRFIDLPINVAGEEQIELLSRAIQSQQKPLEPTAAAEQVAEVVSRNKRGVADNLAETLNLCWPLHPLVACLLGPISRRRFGQNQRSLFGFLNSAEPAAFKAFLNNFTKENYYDTDLLWDYLKVNLEPTILTSPDGHRWALAAEAIDRCEAQVNKGAYLRILKAIALVDLFKGNSGLAASPELLKACFFDLPEDEVERVLAQLQKWSLIIHKKHLGAYAVYAGSDFDIDGAVSKVRAEIREVDFQALKSIAGLQPILAKRHCHMTGSLRWFDVDIVPIKQLAEIADAFTPQNGSIGQFLLAISTENEPAEYCEQVCLEVSQKTRPWDVVVGISKQSWTINSFAIEGLALDKVYNEWHELAGDSVARREIRANISELQGRLEAELNRAFDQACWFGSSFGRQEFSRTNLSVLVSDIADKRFIHSPRIHNELLNRVKPSCNAVGGQNNLLRQMVTSEGDERIGINGFPAEGGLFDSILNAAGLYRGTPPTFMAPDDVSDPCNLLPAWTAATNFLQTNSNRSVSVDEIFSLWKKPPIGIKEGLLPVLGVAYILSQRSILAFYREGTFQSRLTDLDVEILAKTPQGIQLRFMNLSEVSKKLLSGMADIVRELDEKNVLKNLEPIDVGRGLISIYDSIHPWSQRTMHLSKEAIRIRNLFKKANDPNKFLFDDLPGLLGQQIDVADPEAIADIVTFVYEGLKELKGAYPSEIIRLRDLMLAELQVPNLSPQSLTALRERAENIKDVSGDFRLEAFVVRLSKFEGVDADIEGIASLATNKPPRNWIDNDIDRAKVEITELSQKFIRTESFARVKGRVDKRHSLALVVGINGRPTPLHRDFEVADTDREQIDQIVKQLGDIIRGSDETHKNIVLAALVELCAQYIQETSLSIDDKAVS
jgi:hypothetical protein